MLTELRTALIDRLIQVAPDLAGSDYGNAVGFWTERIDFNADSPLDYADWRLVDGFAGHVIGEIVADIADGIGAALMVSLSERRLRIDPVGDGCAYGLIAELVSREDGCIEGAAVLVTQLRFAVSGGLYRCDPAPPVPAPLGADDVL